MIEMSYTKQLNIKNIDEHEYYNFRKICRVRFYIVFTKVRGATIHLST